MARQLPAAAWGLEAWTMIHSPADSRNLAHLLRRAGFGARPDEWSAYAKLGLAGTTQQLLHPETMPDPFGTILQDIQGDYVDFDSLDSIKKWWLYRMSHTPRPLEEKLTLFWHGHFATANYKVDNPRRMWQQNETLRTHAIGNFRTMLQAVSRDPAMLVWLDGADNRKDRPNENYGRELMELFTLGVGGGYTENDVKEAARAFTGWQFDRDTSLFAFHPEQHDDGAKTFLGQTGNFSGDDIIDILVRHPSTANFICTKLFKFFVHEAPSPAEIAPLTHAYFQSGYEIRAVMAAILTSPAFYSDTAIHSKIKSPTEYIVTALRTLDAPFAATNNNLLGSGRTMGQELFNPPNVKGWSGGKTWMNTMTLITRANFASGLTYEMSRRGMLSSRLHHGITAHGTATSGLNTPEQGVDALWGLLLPGHQPSAATRTALVDFASDGSGRPLNFDAKAPGLVALILSAPEYQLA
ncbi:MAG: DUF1800 domain-containing protein [Janthinobacterium lividum]